MLQFAMEYNENEVFVGVHRICSWHRNLGFNLSIL